MSHGQRSLPVLQSQEGVMVQGRKSVLSGCQSRTRLTPVFAAVLWMCLSGVPLMAQTDTLHADGAFVGPRLPNHDFDERAPGAVEAPSEADTPSTLRTSAGVPDIEKQPLVGSEETARHSPASFRARVNAPAEQDEAQATLADGIEPGRLQAGPGWWKTASALAGVIGLMLGLGALFKKWALNHGGFGLMMGTRPRSPSGILEILGRYPVGRGQQLLLLKLDRRVLLVSQSTGSKGSSMTTLCELHEPDDVASLLQRVADADGRSLASKFTQVLASSDRAYNPSASVTVSMPMDAQPSSRATDQARFGHAGDNPARVHDSVGRLSSRLSSLRKYDEQLARARQAQQMEGRL